MRRSRGKGGGGNGRPHRSNQTRVYVEEVRVKRCSDSRSHVLGGASVRDKSEGGGTVTPTETTKHHTGPERRPGLEAEHHRGRVGTDAPVEPIEWNVGRAGCWTVPVRRGRE
jgi:hypothetical protein